MTLQQALTDAVSKAVVKAVNEVMAQFLGGAVTATGTVAAPKKKRAKRGTGVKVLPKTYFKLEPSSKGALTKFIKTKGFKSIKELRAKYKDGTEFFADKPFPAPNK